MPRFIIHSSELDTNQTQQLSAELGALQKKANHFQTQSIDIDPQKVKQLSQKLKIDINALPESFEPSKVKLVISDMDSTLISIECIDEIADMMNLKAEVSEITEAAMRGELVFEQSLTQRVNLLTNLETDALQRVYDERLSLNPGAEDCLAGLKQKNIKFALVSGGFDFFTERLKQNLELDYARANKLGIENQRLTGKVEGKIIGAQAKADFLHELCEQLQINPSQVIAIGDGANDLLMMKEAGLSIAYHAKPKVQEQANTALNFSGLDALLDFINA
ncbi:phosphoserine phosphatase SerB [Thiomicrospira microaerophila]|uniref:phosphoserine phosphatase SerB n=1 Tax=Thiomicrospira microaerophila TaxID=406020 RepID=UPI00200E6D6C|nr:phosphoserine phosphatase SerB [Thiomicrospira microaerophila]UQB42998.1 phosphoserine phosphatase SerB [Thiomicrospira microaerophila]